MPKIHSLIYVTRKCNNNCYFCYESNADKENDYDIRKRISYVSKILYSLKQQGIVLTVAITGGEPTLKLKYLEKYLEMLNRINIKFINLNTNGYRLAECIKFIKEYRVDAINLSKHSLDDNNRFCTWSKIGDMVNELEPRTYIRLNCVLQKSFVGDAYSVMEYIKKAWDAGVRDICFFEMYKDLTKGKKYKNEIIKYKPIIKHLNVKTKSFKGWQCECDTVFINGVNVIFKKGDSEKIRMVEKAEKNNEMTIVRQLIFLPEGKVKYRFNDCLAN